MRPFEIQPRGGGFPEIYGNVSYDSSEIAINTQVNSHKNTFLYISNKGRRDKGTFNWNVVNCRKFL